MNSLVDVRHTVIASCAAFLLGTAVDGQKPERPEQSTLSIPVFVTVLDETQRPVTGLTQEEFEVYDKGKLQAVTAFETKPGPLNVVLMLDTSGSMKDVLDLAKDAAEKFLDGLAAEDKVLVCGFDERSICYPDSGFTGDRQLLSTTVQRLTTGFPSKLYDALGQSVDHLKDREGRRVVVVLADGEDNASKSRLDDAMRKARAADVTVYSIGLEHEYMARTGTINMATGRQTMHPPWRDRTKPDRGLKTLSADTGGGFFLLRDAAEWGPTFAAVARELHSHYVLRISPGVFDGKVHSLEVKVKRAGVTARARRSYIAVSGKSR